VALSVFQPTEPPADPFLPYKVNVFVDNGDTQGPPILIETNLELAPEVFSDFLFFPGYADDIRYVARQLNQPVSIRLLKYGLGHCISSLFS